MEAVDPLSWRMKEEVQEEQVEVVACLMTEASEEEEAAEHPFLLP